MEYVILVLAGLLFVSLLGVIIPEMRVRPPVREIANSMKEKDGWFVFDAISKVSYKVRDWKTGLTISRFSLSGIKLPFETTWAERRIVDKTAWKHLVKPLLKKEWEEKCLKDGQERDAWIDAYRRRK